MVSHTKDIRFKELLSCNVKRLTRPKFNHEFTQFNDILAFATPVEDADTDSEKQGKSEKYHIENDYDPQ